jgi:hypothetical protein
MTTSTLQTLARLDPIMVRTGLKKTQPRGFLDIQKLRIALRLKCHCITE